MGAAADFDVNDLFTATVDLSEQIDLHRSYQISTCILMINYAYTNIYTNMLDILMLAMMYLIYGVYPTYKLCLATPTCSY